MRSFFTSNRPLIASGRISSFSIFKGNDGPQEFMGDEKLSENLVRSSQSLGCQLDDIGLSSVCGDDPLVFRAVLIFSGQWVLGVSGLLGPLGLVFTECF